jgi:putative heme-binding domain-containing protein
MALEPKEYTTGLTDRDEFVRASSIQFSAEDQPLKPATLESFGRMAKSDPSPVVRCYLASAAARLSVDQRWSIVGNLIAHAEDAADQNLPFMYWYAAEPLVPIDVNRAAKLAASSKIPLVREFIARRLAMMSDQPAALAAAVSILSSGDDTAKVQVLRAMTDAFAGKRSVPMPENWTAIYGTLSKSDSADVKGRALTVATIFGDPRALAALRAALADPAAALPQRQSALESLLAAKDGQTLPILQTLVTDPALRSGAIKGLAAYDDAKTPGILIDAYASFAAPEKLAALNTIASRLAWAEQLLATVKESKIPAADLTAPTIRNLYSLGNTPINDWITKNWGSVRATASEKTKEIARYKAVLKPELLARADAKNGRAIFTKTCMQCHTLFDAGAKIGPDLTGSNRANIDYLLENIIDPSAVIGKDYLMVNVKTKDGRFIDGIIKGETADAITFATVTETITLPKSEIASQKVSAVSMMPEGLLAGLKETEVRDLIRYLGSEKQVAEK